ncbi:MAG: site-specific integrase [Oscillospiraceae bacterium]|nr:site-specific integrase [Oscillospiraceae bacterium]
MEQPFAFYERMIEVKATRLPSGSYRVQVVVGKDENGKRNVRSFTADTADEAIFQALTFKNSLGIGANAKTMTVGQAFTQYINARDNILSPATIRGYNIIKKTRLQSIMLIEIHALTVNDVQYAVNQDASRLSHKSIKESVALLKSVLGVQGVELNTKRIALPPKKKKNVIIPEAGEVIKLIIGTDIELPCLLAMWLSLRVSEVRGLQFRDISPDGRTISIERARIYFDGNDVLRECNKTYESTRTNLLPPYIYDLIQKIPHKEPTDFIVNMSYQTINGHFKKIMEKAGYNITFHKLRHEFATTLNDLGIPSNYIQKLGGWSTDNIMKSVYTHTTFSMENECQNKINDFFMSAIESAVNGDDKQENEIA